MKNATKSWRHRDIDDVMLGDVILKMLKLA